MDSDRHAGRTVIVTGGSSGIGRRIAIRFAKEGAAVVVADIRREPLVGVHHDTDVTEPTAARIERSGGEATFVDVDVSDPDSAEALVNAAVETYGQLDVLVNNAGVFVEGDSQETSVEEWNRVLDIDLSGTFYCSKFAVPHLKSTKGDIVNIASVNAYKGGRSPPYSAAKAGAVNLTRDLAVELGPYDVSVNAVCPGYVKTPIQDYLDDAEIEAVRERTLLPRLGSPEDIASVVSFLASEEAAFVHGESIVVDGGLMAH